MIELRTDAFSILRLTSYYLSSLDKEELKQSDDTEYFLGLIEELSLTNERLSRTPDNKLEDDLLEEKEMYESEMEDIIVSLSKRDDKITLLKGQILSLTRRLVKSLNEELEMD